MGIVGLAYCRRSSYRAEKVLATNFAAEVQYSAFLQVTKSERFDFACRLNDFSYAKGHYSTPQGREISVLGRQLRMFFEILTSHYLRIALTL